MASVAAASAAQAENACPAAPSEVVGRRHGNTYGQILKSTAWIGGSAAVNVAVGIIRTKVMAVLLGPSGIGLFGLFTSIADLVRSVAGMGINSSGIRQIAESVGSGDELQIGRTITVLRRVVVLLGLLGAAFLVLFSSKVSVLTFGTDQRGGAVALLSLVVFFGLVSGGQTALIQGMRRISDLAKITAWGAVAGSICSIGIVYFLGESGVVPSLVAGAAISVITSWWYSRKIVVQKHPMTGSQVIHEVVGLLKLGAIFMTSGLMIMGVAYYIRTMIVRKLGPEAAGFYQAAWALGGLYVTIILQAMGSDFFPRLTGVARDNDACNRMVNEQTHVSLLLAGPGILATLTFTPIVIAVFYTPSFMSAVTLLRWVCLGMAMRIIIWPMGYIVLAKGAKKAFFATDLIWSVVSVVLAHACISRFGLNGAGIAFFGSFVIHGCVIYPIVKRLSGFGWSAENRKTVLFFLAAMVVVFGSFFVLPAPHAVGVGVVMTALGAAHSLRTFAELLHDTRLPLPIRRVLSRFRPLNVP